MRLLRLRWPCSGPRRPGSRTCRRWVTFTGAALSPARAMYRGAIARRGDAGAGADTRTPDPGGACSDEARHRRRRLGASTALLRRGAAHSSAGWDRRVEGWLLYHLSGCCLDHGDWSRAWTAGEQSLRLARQIGDRRFEGIALAGLGDYCYYLGDYVRARIAMARACTSPSRSKTGVTQPTK